jgi:hypothetical protein
MFRHEQEQQMKATAEKTSPHPSTKPNVRGAGNNSRRRRIRLYSLAASCVLVLGSGIGIAAATRGGTDTTLATADVPAPVLAYNVAIRKAIAPLLTYIPSLPALFDSLRSGYTSPSDRAVLGLLAEEFAVARNRVSQVPVPPAGFVRSSDLMALACQLYHESALTLASLPQAGTAPAQPRTAASAQLLRDLGDRVIDQYRRLLGIDRVAPGSGAATYYYPAPVPALTQLPQQGPVGAVPDTDLVLDRARDLLQELTTRPADRSPLEQRAPALRSILTVLQAQNAPAEPVIAARLSLMLSLLAEDAKTNGRLATADDLLLMSNDMWGYAGQMPAAPTAISPLPAAAVSRAKAWGGGHTAPQSDPTVPDAAAPHPDGPALAGGDRDRVPHRAGARTRRTDQR